MQLIIDRFEGEWCICEYEAGKTLDMPRALIPIHAKEGEVLCISIDEQKTNTQKGYAEQLRKRLFDR